MINIFSKDDMQTYSTEVHNLIDIAYAPIGGHLNYQTPSELLKSDYWKVVRRDGRIVACCIYKNVQGRKMVALGHDGSRYGKDELKKIFKADARLGRSWAEVSGAMAKFLINLGFRPVHNEHAAEILSKEILGVHGRFKYDRIIAGHVHTKMIVGFPSNKAATPHDFERSEVLF